MWVGGPDCIAELFADGQPDNWADWQPNHIAYGVANRQPHGEPQQRAHDRPFGEPLDIADRFADTVANGGADQCSWLLCYRLARARAVPGHASQCSFLRRTPRRWRACGLPVHVLSNQQYADGGAQHVDTDQHADIWTNHV